MSRRHRRPDNHGRAQHAVHAKALLEQSLLVCLVKLCVAVGVEQALRCGEQCAKAVHFDTSAFEFKVEVVNVFAFQHRRVTLNQMGVDGIVERSLKLASPTIETEVEQFGSLGGGQGQKGVVACPSVVSIASFIYNVCGGALGQLLVNQAFHGLGVGCHNEQRLARGYFVGQTQIAGSYLGQHICPIGASVWPCKLHTALQGPFGSQGAFQCCGCFVVRYLPHDHAQVESVARGSGW